MKKILNISLYVIIFLLVALINVISIKKFFDNKQRERLENIIATNIVSSLVSFNEVEALIEEVEEETVTLIEENSIIDVEVNESESDIKDAPNELKEIPDTSYENTIDNSLIIFDGLAEDALITKLEKSLKNELSGTGINFVEYYKMTGLDPYLAVAIVLHETGCTWTCSNLVKQCYNYGGMKGGVNKYKDTNYTCFSTKEEGINAYLNMLYNNYYSKGLTTAELINPKYATSLEWAVKINNYIEKIKNN